MKLVELGEFIARKNDSVDPSKHTDEIFELYSIPSYDSGIPELLEGSEIGSSKKSVKENDVLLSRIVPHIRRCWVVEQTKEHRKIGSSEWIVFRSKEINPHYLRYFLISDRFHTRFMQTVSGVGGSLLRARPSQVAKLKIPLPPLPIQQKIAEVLDRADALRQRNRQIMRRYDQLAQSVFLDMFGDPVKNPKGWDKGTIRDLLKEAKYGTSSKSSDNGKFPYLRMNNITYGGYWDLKKLKYLDLNEQEQEKYLVKKGDLLFNRTNSKKLVGKTAVWSIDSRFAIAGYLIRCRTNSNANPYYIWGFLNSKYGKLILENMCKNIVGMANINAQELQDIKILIPPIDFQNRFAGIIQRIEDYKQKQQLELNKSEELFQSLLQRAFKGELFPEKVEKGQMAMF